jgi:hypothetical protein
MDLVEVTAHFDDKGTITPIHFTWKGRLQRVESTGRRWHDETGQHMLVMVSSGRIYKLTYKSAEGRWYLSRSTSERQAV